MMSTFSIPPPPPGTPPPQSDPSPVVQALYSALNQQLSEADRSYFIHALSEYKSNGRVNELLKTLKFVLNSPEKRELLKSLRHVIPPQDRQEYDREVETILNSPPSNHEGSYYTFPHAFAKTRSRAPVPELYSKTMVLRKADISRYTPPRNVKKLFLQRPDTGDNEPGSYGFCIRGGAEHGIGIYVSVIDSEGVAEREGLFAGDEIIRVNGTGFENLTHEEAAKIIQDSSELFLIVNPAGRIPLSKVTHQHYLWIDRKGQIVPPPHDVINRSESSSSYSGRMSETQLLKGHDERKVNVLVDEGSNLGLMVRGGKEFNLGIYVTGIDPFSVSEFCGLKVGDQILDVNGRSFQDISHKESCNILKSSTHMVMIIKDVGRIPYACTQYDHTEWITKDDEINPENDDWVHTAENIEPERASEQMEPRIERGVAGSQLMLSSISNNPSWSMMLEHSRQFLHESDQATLHLLLESYRNKQTVIDNLVIGLMELLDTPEKLSLLSDIRDLIYPHDIDRYNSVVLVAEMNSLRLRRHDDETDTRSIASSIPAFVDARAPSDSVRVARIGVLEDDHHYGDMGREKAFIETSGTDRRGSNRRVTASSAFDGLVIPPPPPLSINSSRVSLKSDLEAAAAAPADGPSTQSGPYPELWESGGEPSSEEVRSTMNVFSGVQSAQPRSTETQSLKYSLSSEGGYNEEDNIYTGIESDTESDKGTPPPPADDGYRYVRIYRSAPTLGIAVEGGAKTKQPVPRIKDIIKGGSADLSGQLEVGDIIIEVNGLSLQGLEHQQAARAIAMAFKSKLQDYMDVTVKTSP